MTTNDEMVAFLRARIADPIGLDAQAAANPSPFAIRFGTSRHAAPYDCEGGGEYSSCADFSEWHERVSRALLLVVDNPPTAPDAWIEWEDTCHCFARIWSGHPDFQLAWA